jgi:hypothetical protein
VPAPSLEQLKAEAQHHRDRLALYRARALTGRPVNAAKMRALERAAQASEERLRNARP